MTNIAAIARVAVQDLSTLEAVEYLLGLIEVSLPGQDPDVIGPMIEAGLTRSEASVLAPLLAAGERGLARRHLFENVYATFGESPDTKIIDIFLCKVRAKAAANGWPLRIINIRGYGFRVERTGPLPWEVAP